MGNVYSVSASLYLCALHYEGYAEYPQKILETKKIASAVDGGGGGNHAYPQVIELLKVL